MSDKFWGDLLLMIGFGSGLYWFGDGFRIFREYRLVANTPRSHIRSLAMGRVEIEGIATGQQTLTSPVTHSACFTCKVEIERWEQDRGRGRWVHYWTDTRELNFYIDDGTGKVLVNPRGSEYDLPKRRVREIGRQRGILDVLLGTPASQPIESEATDAELGEYVSNPWTVSVARGNLPVNLSGVSTGAEPALIGEVYKQTFRLSGGASRTDRLRFTEYCIVPNQLYDVIGTCVENPKPKDESDRNLICKGEQEPTFLISSRGEKGLEGALRDKAVIRILGGAALAIASLYIFVVLVRVGWL